MPIKTIFLIFLLFNFLSLGCATQRKSKWALTAGSFVTGAAVGSSAAPENERKELHAMYWGALTALGAALVSDFIFDESKEAEKLKLENEKLKAELELMQNANTVLLKEGTGYFKNTQGEEFFQSGKARWKIYQIDRWVKDGPNRLYHQDRMVELVP